MVEGECIELGLATAIVLLMSAAPAVAQDAECRPAIPVIRSDSGLVFEADAYAWLEWKERSSGGRMLTYGAHVWRGRIGTRRAYLTFDEIPGTSGPNHHMALRLHSYPVRPRWQETQTRYDLGRWFIVRSGSLKGEWTVENCT